MEEAGDSAGRGVRVPRDWTKGNILHNLLRLSWPMVITNTLTVLGPTIDMIWVGRLGAVYIAAVAIGGITIGLVITAVMGLVMGTRAMVARFIGAGDVIGANHVAQQSLVISLAFSIAMAAVGFFFTEAILNLLGLEADVVTAGTPYIRLMFIGSAAVAFRMMAEGIMQASGDTVTPMWTSVVYMFFRIALCPLLVFGKEMFPWWMFPGMGISGAAVSLVISQSLGAVILLWMLFIGRSRLRLTLRNFHLDFNIIRRIVRIGFPAFVSMIQQNLSHLILVRLMAPFGTISVAAHGIVQRVEMIMLMPAMAIGMGGGVLVGQNLGARQPRQAEKSAWLAAAVVEAIIATCSLALLLWPGAVVRIFNPEPGLVATTSSFLRIAVAGYIVVGFMAVFMHSLYGAGDTVLPMIISLIMIWGITIPLAYFLPQVADLGVLGVRWGMAAGMIFATVTYAAYFQLGRWKRKKV